MSAIAIPAPASRAFRRFLPYALAMLLIIVVRLPFQSQGLDMFIPHIGLIFTFFWAVHNPRLTPYWGVFLLGLFEDLLSLTPTGLTPILLLSLVAALHNQRRFFVHRPFTVTWAGFAIVAIMAFFAIWVLGSAHDLTLLPPLPLLAEIQVTILAFPPLAWLFARFQKLVAR